VKYAVKMIAWTPSVIFAVHLCAVIVTIRMTIRAYSAAKLSVQFAIGTSLLVHAIYVEDWSVKTMEFEREKQLSV